MPAFRAASLRKTPSKTDATAKSRRDWFASRTRPALRRSSSAENSVRVMLTVIDPTPQANQALQGITAPQLCEQLNESAHPTVGISGCGVAFRARLSSLRPARLGPRGRNGRGGIVGPGV